MAVKLILVKVYDKNNQPYQSIKVVVGSMSPKYTNKDGRVVFEYPWDTGQVAIYVDGTTVFSNYVSKIESDGLLVRKTNSGWELA